MYLRIGAVLETAAGEVDGSAMASLERKRQRKQCAGKKDDASDRYQEEKAKPCLMISQTTVAACIRFVCLPRLRLRRLNLFFWNFPPCAVLCCAAPLAFPLAFRVAAARARRVKSHIGKWQSAAREKQGTNRAQTSGKIAGRSIAAPPDLRPSFRFRFRCRPPLFGLRDLA